MTNFSKDIEACLHVLKSGGVILYPTDTIWGLGCDATNEEAVEKVYRIKRREESKSMIILIADELDILHYVANPDMAVFEYLKKVKKPTTIIYDGGVNLASNVTHENGSIAIRIVKDDFCRHLIKRFKKPIVSTSANISGDPNPRNYQEIQNVIFQAADYIVEHRRNESTFASSSALIRWNNNGNPTVLRS